MTCPHCGCDIEPAKSKRKPRSVPQHRRYFAMIKVSFENWPERHEFQPASEDHLRKWLQAKAGHRHVITIDTADMTPSQAVAATAGAFRSGDPFAFVVGDGTKLHIVRSASVSFDDLPHREACALFDAVADVIEIESGLRVDDIMPAIARRRSEVSHVSPA